MRAASAASRNPKARTLRGSGSEAKTHGCAENACETMQQTIRRGNAVSAKHGSKDAFAQMYARPFYRVCRTCEAQKRCVKCSVAKPESAFGVAAWKA